MCVYNATSNMEHSSLNLRLKLLPTRCRMWCRGHQLKGSIQDVEYNVQNILVRHPDTVICNSKFKYPKIQIQFVSRSNTKSCRDMFRRLQLLLDDLCDIKGNLSSVSFTLRSVKTALYSSQDVVTSSSTSCVWYQNFTKRGGYSAVWVKPSRYSASHFEAVSDTRGHGVGYIHPVQHHSCVSHL